jgi:hypothetical protein
MARSSIRYVPGRRPGRAASGKRVRGAVGGDQDGAGVAQVGPQRLPGEPAQRGGRRLHVTRPATVEGSPPGVHRLVDRPGGPQRHDGHGPAAAQDEGEQPGSCRNGPLPPSGGSKWVYTRRSTSATSSGSAPATSSGPGPRPCRCWPKAALWAARSDSRPSIRSRSASNWRRHASRPASGAWRRPGGPAGAVPGQQRQGGPELGAVASQAVLDLSGLGRPLPAEDVAVEVPGPGRGP